MAQTVLPSTTPASTHQAMYHPVPARTATASTLQGMAYTLGLLLIAPITGLHSRMKGIRYRTRFWHRYGLLPRPKQALGKKHLVLHCHNIGELRTAIPLVKLLKARHPNWTISMLSKAFEPDQTVGRLLPEVSHAYFVPLDAPLFTGLALRRLRPDAVITVENDLRTHLVTQAKRRGAATLFLGGELSARERSRHRTPAVFRMLLNNTDVIAMRAPEDARELQAVGAEPDRLFVCGNLRFDLGAGSLAIADSALRGFLAGWHDAGPLFVAGSTYPEEEAMLLQAVKAVRRIFPTLRAVIAPRRSIRAGEVLQAATACGLTACLRSRIDDPEAATADLLVLDTIGELTSVYGAGDVAYVGGSLINRGGHNIVEAAVHGIPVLFGQYVATNREISEALLAAQAAWVVTDADDLAARLRALLHAPHDRQALGERARAVVANFSGATETCLRLVEDVLASRDAQR